jgi:hypothetical protein
MPQQFLHSAAIITPSQEMGRQGMPQEVTTHRVGQSDLEGSFLNAPLQRILVEVMPTHLAIARVYGQTARQQSILPNPCPAALGYFLSRAGHSYTCPKPAARSSYCSFTRIRCSRSGG